MKNQFILTIALLSTTACTPGNILYRSDAFTIMDNSVIQDSFKVEVKNSTSLISDYVSPYKEFTRKVFDFKFSLNGDDNERFPGENHQIFLESDRDILESAIYNFGTSDPVEAIIPENRKDEILSDDIRVIIKVNMDPVLTSFEEKGYYTLFNGEQFPANKFEGVFIAGGALPLSWDFANLKSHPELELTDLNDDRIFEIELLVKKYQQVDARKDNAYWKAQNIDKNYPNYTSDILLSDAMHQMSLEELKLDIRSDSVFMAGAKWPGVWTRDISYSILLSLAILEPEVAKKSLLQKVQNHRILQDTGTGGSWPVSTDRMTWSLAAWEIFIVTGDTTWLEEAYSIIRNSAEDDLLTILNPETGLAYGESSFLDWREQSYPKWMDPKDIFMSQNLGTNIVHYQTYNILAKMASLLDAPEAETKYQKIATSLKKSINQHMWLQNNGYYSQFIYGRSFQSTSPRSETLGEALSILFGVANTKQAESIVSKAPTTPFGTTCIYPQIPDMPPYHSNGIWPFVEAYWGWAAAKAENSASVEHSIASIYRPASLFLSNKENMVAETGDFMGTEINSDRQLWSIAGNLAIVYRIFYGMEFSPDGLHLAPFIPKSFRGQRKLSDFAYRGSILDISISGYGNQIQEMYLDGQLVRENTVPSSLVGNHDIIIHMNNQMPEGIINLQRVKFAPDTPVLEVRGNMITWDAIIGANLYNVYKNGGLFETVETTAVELDQSIEFSEYQVMAIGEDGLESFLSEPVSIYDIEVQTIKPENTPYSTKYAGFTGNGYIELTKESNLYVSFTFNVPEEGLYSIDFRYNNGHGPINTNNKCAIRSATVDGTYLGVFALAQRGNNNWSDWGYTNRLKIQLEPGPHSVMLDFLPHNENMNTETNSALLDLMRIIKLD